MLAEILEAEPDPGADMSPEFIATMTVLSNTCRTEASLIQLSKRPNAIDKLIETFGYGNNT